MRFQKFLLIFALTLAILGCSKTENDHVTRDLGEPASAAASKEANAVVQVGGGEKSPIVSVSSQSGDLGPQGLLVAAKPGWHSPQPPKYPESILVDFQAPKTLNYIGFLQQEGQPSRAPKAIRIDISEDQKVWSAVGGSDDVCMPNMPDGWTNVDLPKSVTSRYLKVTIFSNCGDQQLLTLRGLRAG